MKNTHRYFKVLTSFLVLTIFAAWFSFGKKSYSPVKTEVGRIIEPYIFQLDHKKITSSDLSIDLNSFSSPKFYESPIKKANFDFTALSIEWDEKKPPQTGIEAYIRFLEKGQWTDYEMIHLDEEEKFVNLDGQKRAFYMINQTEAFQYKIVLTSANPKVTPVLSDLTFTYLRSKSSGPPPKPGLFSKLSASLSIGTGGRPPIVSRKDWSADESIMVYNGDQRPLELMYENDKEFREKFKDEFTYEKIVETNEAGQLLKWPLEYPKEVKKIVLHHTATSKDLDDPAQAIRNIHYYHTMSRGFGDIGYNFIIDSKGVIYEGRKGGETVVGGHTSGYNHGSIGIALLGDFQTKQPSYEMTQSLLKLINYLGKKYQIDPNKSSMFRGENIPNIVGHRDVGNTSCPGDQSYSILPAVRKLLAGVETITPPSDKKSPYAFEEISVRTLLNMQPENSEKVEFILKNKGTETWNNETYLVANSNNDNNGRINFVKDPQNEFSIGKVKETSVAPGEIGHFEVTAQSGLRAGIVNFEITPLYNGKKKTSDYLYLPIYIRQPDLSYEFYRAQYPKSTAEKGEKLTGWIELKNTGNVSWSRGGEFPISLGTDQPKDHVSRFSPQGGNRIGFLEQEKVRPGEIGRFNLQIQAPTVGGVFEEHLTPVMDGLAWLADKDIHFKVTVKGEKYEALFLERSPNINFAPGETKEVWVKIQNSGDVVWGNKVTNRVVTRILKKKEVIVSAVALNKEVAPGENGLLKFKVTAPQTAGKYRILLYPNYHKHRLTKEPLYFEFYVGAAGGDAGKMPENTIENSEGNIPTAESGGDIRIKITFDQDPVIAGNGNFQIVVGDQEIETIGVDDHVQVNYLNENYVLRTKLHALSFKKYPRFVPEQGTIMEIQNMERRPEWDKNLNDNKFRGVLEVRLVDNQLEVINELPLEDYLKGLAEEPNYEPIEKHKAIIVAARSYARHYQLSAEKFPGKPYHGSDDPAIFQKYRGYGVEARADNVVKAVNETAGEVVTYKGIPVKTPYFSQSDGRTRSAEEVFGWKDTPWLVSVPDPYCEGLTLWGHGVGMSGCGAKGAAVAGKTYKEILQYYYTGTEVSKVY